MRLKSIIINGQTICRIKKNLIKEWNNNNRINISKKKMQNIKNWLKRKRKKYNSIRISLRTMKKKILLIRNFTK